jgi:hypothetical protein
MEGVSFTGDLEAKAMGQDKDLLMNSTYDKFQG